MELADNTFLITGGSSGLGAACAELFSESGANVVIADVDRKTGKELAAQLGQRAVMVETDVTQTSSIEAAIETALQHFGSLQGVVNCAGILGASRVVGREGPHDLDLFKRVIEVNLIGTFNVLRLAATVISTSEPNEEGERGVIINTSSVSTYEGQIGQAAYSASKGGVAALSMPAARELARFGIRVMAIAPGVFATPMMQAASEGVVQSLEASCLFPSRLGKPTEFALLARQIVENPMLNGGVIRLDGAARMPPK